MQGGWRGNRLPRRQADTWPVGAGLDGAGKGKAQRWLEMAMHGEGTQKGFLVSPRKAAEGTLVPVASGAGDGVTKTVGLP